MKNVFVLLQSIVSFLQRKCCGNVQVTDFTSGILNDVTESGTVRMDLMKKTATMVRFEYIF